MDCARKIFVSLRVYSRIVPLAATVLVIATAVGSCAPVRPRPAPLTVSEIIIMNDNGVPAAEIIRRIRASGTAYRLTTRQIARLARAGVPERVIAYMQETYRRAVQHERERRNLGAWQLGPDGYWYGGLPFGWEDFGEHREEREEREENHEREEHEEQHHEHEEHEEHDEDRH